MAQSKWVNIVACTRLILVTNTVCRLYYHKYLMIVKLILTWKIS